MKEINEWSNEVNDSSSAADFLQIRGVRQVETNERNEINEKMKEYIP